MLTQRLKVTRRRVPRRASATPRGRSPDSVQVVRQRDHRLRQRPAAAPRPGRVVDLEQVAEDRSRLRVEDRPGDLDVAGRVADAQRAPVEETGDASVLDEQVSRVEVAVDPDGRPVPVRRSERVLPRRRHGVGVDQVAERGDPGAGRLVSRRERAAATARRRAAVGSMRRSAASSSARSTAARGRSKGTLAASSPSSQS